MREHGVFYIIFYFTNRYSFPLQIYWNLLLQEKNGWNDLVDLVNGFLSQKWYSVVLDIKTREAIEYEWEKD